MSLSGGQKQRVAIASAIASKRSILFFDEPTSGLDYRHMKEVAAVLRQLSTEGVTVYVITHDLELLLDCCTDIIADNEHCLCLFSGNRSLKCGQLLCAQVLQRGHAELLLEYRCKLSLIGIANLLRDFCNGAAGVR